jgi:Mce-associated membrane protein
LTDTTTSGIEDPGDRERPPARLSRRAVQTLIAVLTVLLVVGVVAAAFFGINARENDRSAKQRAAASTVANQFALRMDKVDGTAFDGYLKGINQLLTTKAKTKNDKVFKVMKQSYEAAKVKGSGKVLLTAVGDSDEDSATVLVVHDASVTTTQGNIDHHYRWSVSLVKVKGSWLVDDFNPVS